MTAFSEFYDELERLVQSFEKKGTQLKVEHGDGDIVKIFGEGTSSLSRAKNGLEDVSELAYATAEHHPYWNLLFHCAQISKTVLDKWESSLTKDELDEIRWSIKELENSCAKISKNTVNE